MCSKYMGEDANGGNCNQRCLIVECWLDLIVDVHAPDFNFDLGVHDVIMFIVAVANMGISIRLEVRGHCHSLH